MAHLMEKWSSSYFLISCKLGPFDCSKGVWEKRLTLWGNCIYFDAHKFLGEEQLQSNQDDFIDPDSLMYVQSDLFKYEFYSGGNFTGFFYR